MPARTVARERAASHITPDIREWLLARLRFPVLATVSSGGMPSQSVMWFDLDPEREDTILMNTRVGRRKERHLRRDNRASLIFPEGYFSRTFVGHVELDDDRAKSLADITALAERYGSDPTRFEGQERVTLRLRVERTHSQFSVGAATGTPKVDE
ncbi:MAG: pyridoxamine 5'-phosphate oxidase family protein [Candidatus Limnocylindria bacterium]